MPLDNTKLLDFLGEIDKELSCKIVLVAVGGTAMTLVDAKPSTILTLILPFQARIVTSLNVVTVLPGDYLEKSKPIATNLKNIDLRALDPVDIIITKIARLNKRDEQDIESCITNFQITQTQIERRAKDMNHAGNDEVFVNNLKTVRRKFFKE